MSFGKRLTELRQLKNLSQVDMAQALGIAKSTYHGYENDKREPDIQKIKAICKTLKISADELFNLTDIQPHYDNEDTEMLKKLSQLDVFDKKAVIALLNALSERQNAPKTHSESQFLYLDIFPISSDEADNAVSSLGTPALKVKNTSMSQNSDFLVRIPGDSMLPRFSDGDLLLIKKQNTLKSGDYGLFRINGRYYIRQYGIDRLISLNTEYRDIFISDNDDFKIIGKILGKL